MTPTTRSLIERPDLDADLSERVDQQSISRLIVGLSVVAAIMVLLAAAWIVFGSASFLSLMIISALTMILITIPSSSS